MRYYDDDDDDIFNVSNKERRAGRDADMVYANRKYATGLRLHLTLLFKPFRRRIR